MGDTVRRITRPYGMDGGTPDRCPPRSTLRAVALTCTLKGGDQPSSTDALLRLVVDALAEHDVTAEV